MSDYSSRGRGFAGGIAPAKHVENTAAPTPAEQAAERTAAVAREVTSVDEAIQSVQQAASANDASGWSEAKQSLDRRLASARKALILAQAHAKDLSPKVAQQLAAAEAALAEHERRASVLADPPRGWAETSREAQMLAVIAAPIEGSARDGWNRKMSALKAELAQLSVADSRALTARLSRRHPNDPIAMGLMPNVRITQARFDEVLAFLAGARKREAVRPLRAFPASSLVSTAPVDTTPSDVLQLHPENDRPPASRQASTKAERVVPMEATRLYLATNINTVWNALRSHLQGTSWPAASPQFTWRQPNVFADKLVAALHDAVMQSSKAGDIDLAKLDGLLYPAQVHDELAGMLPIQTKDGHAAIAPSRHWIPAIGLRLGQLVHAALMPSLQRMTQRYVDAMNARADQAKAGPVQLHARDLIASSPLDRHAARAIVVPGVAEVIPDGSVRPAGRTSLRPVRLTWESRDPRLWNWVRADLADATVEEVAASLYAYAREASGDPTSYYAYGIAAAPPMFGLPVSWAVQFPEARQHAPESIKQGTLSDEQSDSIAARLGALAATDMSDGIAMQQARDTHADNVAASDVLAACDDGIIQLGALRTTMTGWGLASDLVPVIMHAVRKRDALRKAPVHEVRAYAAVALGQRDRLARISGSIAGVVRAGAQFSASHDDDNPIRPILARYVQAAASAQLATTSEALITAAQDLQRGLVIKSLQANQLASMHAMDEMRAGPAMNPAPPKDERSSIEQFYKIPAELHAPRSTSAGARSLSRPYLDVQARARVLENTLLQGGEVDQDELQRVQLESQEIALRARLESLLAHLEVIDDEADKAGEGLAAKIASLGSSRFRGLRDASQSIRAQLVIVRRDLILDQKSPKPRSGDGDGLMPPPLDILAKRDALAAAQARFTRISEDRELGTFLEQAYRAIENQRLRTAIVGAVAMIGVSFLGSGVGSAVGKGMTRALTTAKGVQAASQLSLGARAGIFAARVATETVVNAGGQVALTGGDLWDALVENALMTLGMEGTSAVIAKEVGAARAFHKQLAEQVAQLEAIEAKAATRAAKLGGAARVLGRETLAISGHTIMGMALGALSGKILTAIDGKQGHAAGGIGWEDTIIQGASVAIGRLAHARVASRKQSLEELARHSKSADAQHLVEHAAELEALSAAVTKSGDAKRALDVLAHQERLIVEETRIIDELLARADHGGYRAEDLARTKSELAAQLGNAGDVTMLAVKLHLSGLRELAPGTLWSGTPDEIARGVREIQATRPDARIEQDLGTTTVRVGNHSFEFHEVVGARQERASNDHARTRTPEATHELSNTVVHIAGSEMRGGTRGVERSTEHSTSLLARATATAGAVHLPGVFNIRPSSKPGTFLVMLADMSWTSIEVTVARTDGSNPAHLVPNSARMAKLDGLPIRGEHVLQISERLPLDQLDRVVAHGMARIVDAHRLAIRGKYAGHDGGVLSPDDRGRIAEIDVLVRTARTGDPAAAARARAELAMLTEYLGLRDGAPLANERRTAIDIELRNTPGGREELARAIREPLTDAQRKAAFADLAAEQADHQRRSPPRDAPPSMTSRPGDRLTPEQLAEYADVAARLRHLVSQRTLAKYRALQAQHPGRYPRIEDVLVGGGAALAGRDPRTLLVDARGRWQKDGSENLAQVGQQLQDLYRARFGDVREAAAPGERIPLDAIRYWEDSIAAQGEVIDGHGTLRVENGKLLLEITPLDGSEKLILEVGGTYSTAPGFPDERFLGAAFSMPASEAILAIDRGLRELQPKYPEPTSRLLAELAKVHGVRDADLSRVDAILATAPPELVNEMKALKKDGLGQRIDTGMKSAHARTEWDRRVAIDAQDGERQMFSGKESNHEDIKKTAKRFDDIKRVWTIAGTSGNAVSAAEIILDNTKHAEVVMVGRDTPEGLFRNGQFRQMAERYGRPNLQEHAERDGIVLDLSKSEKRLDVFVNKDLDFTTPEFSTGHDRPQRIELRTRTKKGLITPVKKGQDAIAGDMLVVALGSPGQFPTEIGALAMQARRADPGNVDHPEPTKRPVWVEADFATDGRYLGYTVHIRLDGQPRRFEVRGAASRAGFIPEAEFMRMGSKGREQIDRIGRANVDDAPSKSGNFPGGLSPTTTQTSQQHGERAQHKDRGRR